MGLQHPELRKDYEDLDDNDKMIARYEKERADASKAYEVATYLNNQVTYEALWEVHDPTREFFKRIGDTWDDGIVPLQMCLEKIYESWSKLGLPDPCPLEMSDRDKELLRQRCAAYEDWYEVQDFAKKYLGTDDDGWISPYLNFDVKCQQNKELIELLIERRNTEDEVEASKTRRMWPFPV
ncbi:MAG: hypothetical protein Q9174_003974 [Haloplaca sp. 1 TL-2023]